MFSCIAEPLAPFSDGIYATKSVLESGIHGLGSQFREHAEIYAARYHDSDSKAVSLARVLKRVNVNLSGKITALDIGCGSGSATFAILSVFPESVIYATDLSPEMIGLVKRRADYLGIGSDRVVPIIANASTLKLTDNSFDFVSGSSMIHHLMDPDSFIDGALRSLKPGGVALFTEPFQAGHIVLRTLLSAIVQLAPYKGDLEEKRLRFFKDYIYTIDVMCSDERDPVFYEKLDDKFMFSTSLFKEAARRNKCSLALIPNNSPEAAFSIKVADLLWQGLGDKEPLPRWVQDILSEADRATSLAARDELLLEASVVFIRS